VTKPIRVRVLVLLVIGLVSTIVSACLEYVGAHNSTVLFYASVAANVTAWALIIAISITRRSTMRVMTIWPGTCAAISFVASVLIFIVSLFRDYQGMAADASLIMLAVSGIFQLAFAAVWYLYVRIEPEEPAVRRPGRDWTPGHP